MCLDLQAYLNEQWHNEGYEHGKQPPNMLADKSVEASVIISAAQQHQKYDNQWTVEHCSLSIGIVAP